MDDDDALWWYARDNGQWWICPEKIDGVEKFELIHRPTRTADLRGDSGGQGYFDTLQLAISHADAIDDGRKELI